MDRYEAISVGRRLMDKYGGSGPVDYAVIADSIARELRVGRSADMTRELRADRILLGKVRKAYPRQGENGVRQRQITFRKFRDAQLVASGIRAVAGQDTYAVADGSIPSPAGSFMDAGYVLTDAPMPIVRKAAKMHNVEIPHQKNPDVFRVPQPGVLSEKESLGMIHHLAGHLVESIDKKKNREQWDDADSILSLASALLRQLKQGTHTNPSNLVTYLATNPSASLMSHHVQALLYRHVRDGNPYIHTFGGSSEVPIRQDKKGRQFMYFDELPNKTDVDMRSDKNVVVLSRPDGKPLADDF